MPCSHCCDDIDVNEIIESINLRHDVRAGLLGLPPKEIAAVLGELANLANISTASFKVARVDFPSFSFDKYEIYDERPNSIPFTYRDPPSAMVSSFKPPGYFLPLSFHDAMFKNAWGWKDLYLNVSANKEERDAKLLEPYIVAIAALFQGRVVDRPHRLMHNCKHPLVDDVEHKLWMAAGGIIFIVVFETGPPHYQGAHMLLELLAAAEVNKTYRTAGCRIYGLLTDLSCFEFYSYDPIGRTFYHDETIVCRPKRMDGPDGMINLSNKIFSAVLSAYVDGLREITRNDESGMHIGTAEQTNDALGFAEKCLRKFEEPVANLQDIEGRANVALEFLAKSVSSIPRYNARFMPNESQDISMPAKVDALAARVIREEHEQYLLKIGAVK